MYWSQEKHSTSFTVWDYRCLQDENSFLKWKLPVDNHRGGLREIEIKLNPPSRGNGLKIPIRLNIFISPPCRRVTVIISKFGPPGNLKLTYPDIKKKLRTLEVTKEDIDNYQFDLSGHVDRLKFFTDVPKADVK
jgi:hypothetical protein